MASKRKIRLHKYIANCGYTSRRRAEILIQAGRVKLDGKVVTNLGVTLDPTRSTVHVNGEKVELPETVTIILNKPRGILTSTHDTHDRLTVMDILPRRLAQRGVLPAGRLDRDTEGLLILTNDGDLGHRITHPRYETEKEYEALVSGHPQREKLEKLETGVMIEGRKTSPAKLVFVRNKGDHTQVRIVLREGRKRQVRRMFQSIGHEVAYLKRVRVGMLGLGDLSVGEWRELGADEIRRLVGPEER